MQLKYKQRTVKQHVLVTPAMAKMILETHNKRNRPISRAYVEQFKDALKEGEFKEVNAITINKSGNLQDGQHRLKAVAETGISAYMTIIFGQDDNDFDLTNTCHAMTINEFAKTNSEELNGVKPEMFSAASCAKHLVYDRRTRGPQIPKRKLKKLIEDDIDTFRFLSSRKRKKPKYMYNKSMLHALEYLLYKMETEENKPKVIEFFDNLWNMELNTTTHSVENAYVTWIENNAFGNHTGTKGEDLTLRGTCYAYEAFKNGKVLEKLRIPKNYQIPDFSVLKPVIQQ